jgi:hypothetical protein
MTDLFAVMSTLVAPNGKILIPGIYDQVAPLTGMLYLPFEFTLWPCVD